MVNRVDSPRMTTEEMKLEREVTCNAPQFPICSPSLSPSHFLSLLIHHPSLNMMLVTAHRILGRKDGRTAIWSSIKRRRKHDGEKRWDGAAEDAYQSGGEAAALKCIHIVRRSMRRKSAFPVFKSILVDSEKVLFILATSNSPLHPFMHPPVTSNCPAFVQRL